jgi:hypothetical protein
MFSKRKNFIHGFLRLTKLNEIFSLEVQKIVKNNPDKRLVSFNFHINIEKDTLKDDVR